MGEIWGRQTIKTERERERRDRGQQLEKPLKCVARTIKNDEFIRIFCFFFTFLPCQIRIDDRIEMIHSVC